MAEPATGRTREEPGLLRALRNLDLAILALALPLFVAADLPLAGYAAAGGAWLLQRAIKLIVTRRAEAAEDARTTVGLIAGGMIARGWLAAGIVFGVGIATDDRTGLSAAVLFIALFTIYFTMTLALRPAAASRGTR